MHSFRALIVPALACSLTLAFTAAAGAQTQFPLGPDSKPQAGVPKGEVLKFSFENSKIFPGTYRDYWIYVPAQYRPDKPACLYVNQDGVQWQAPTVFDNLIHKGEMPVTIGVFVMHGRVRAKDGDAALDRFNRSFEYDGLGDRYARFLIEELLPEVEAKKASDGRAIRLSRDPNDRAIGGSSSGAVCAFTAAWERPDQFRRVFSAIGTYVGLRGADRYPTLIRKYEPKPLRVFLQGGSNDNNIYAGDWWMANQMMERALTFAGYEVNHVWGDGGHNGQHGTAIFPDAMRWLWKDWPKPIQPGTTKNATLTQIGIPGEDWVPVADSIQVAGGLTANAQGEILFIEARTGKIHRVGRDGSISSYPSSPRRNNGLAIGKDGRLYTVAADGKLLIHDSSGTAKTVADGLRGGDVTAAHNGSVYVAEPSRKEGEPSRIWLVRPNGRKQLVDTGDFMVGGITLSPDQTLLYAVDRQSQWVYSYQVQPDGSLAHKQQYFWLHLPDHRNASDAGGMQVDREGRLYAATNLGVQVCDQPGRVHCILPTPGGPVSALAFGGENLDMLYVVSGGKLYRRKLKTTGVHSWATPNKPPQPRL